ncbi:hypothetical protein KR032_011807, partial [Drosophila birchii]
SIMSSLVLAILLVFGSLAGLVAFEIDKAIYCDLPYCGIENVVCRKANNSFPCRPKARLVALRSDKKDIILSTVNQFRNSAAAGLTQKLFPAGRMVRIEWSRELEHFAMMDVMSCLPTPRPCMTSPNFPNMGSIFDRFSYVGKMQDSVKIITNMILKWTSEARYVTPKQIRGIQGRDSRDLVNNTALLMSERNTHMGCSAVKLKFQRVRYFYLSCTFATVKILGTPIYRLAKMPGQMCHKRDEEFNNVCAAGEKYVENSKLVALSKYI